MNPQYRIGILAAALCAAAATISVAAPAQAAPATDHRTTTLLLSVRLTEHPQQAPQTAILRCGSGSSSDGGTHVRAAQACDDLRAVDGNLQEMVYQDGPCTLEYLPITATAVGLWEGRPVLYRDTFSNRCDMLRATGNVFHF